MIRELIAGIALVGCVGCAASNKMLKTSGYYDTRGRVDGTVTAAGELPTGIRYFGFLDYGTSGMDNNINRSYGQVKTFRTGPHGLGVSTEYNRDLFTNSDTIRAGPMFTASNANGSFNVRYYPLATNDVGQQLSLSGSIRFGDNYLEGFFNRNFRPHKNDNTVSEIQFGRRLVDNLYGVVEFRHNGHEQEKNEKGNAIAVGVEWKIK